jgi:hypothetical protein
VSEYVDDNDEDNKTGNYLDGEPGWTFHRVHYVHLLSAPIRGYATSMYLRPYTRLLDVRR